MNLFHKKYCLLREQKQNLFYIFSRLLLRGGHRQIRRDSLVRNKASQREISVFLPRRLLEVHTQDCCSFVRVANVFPWRWARKRTSGSGGGGDGRGAGPMRVGVGGAARSSSAKGARRRQRWVWD